MSDDKPDLNVVPFTAKEPEPDPDEIEIPTAKELFENYLDKSGSNEILVIGINEDNHLSYVTNITDLPLINLMVDRVKLDLMH